MKLFVILLFSTLVFARRPFRPDELLTEQNKSDPDLDLDSLDLEQTPEFGVYDEDEDNISKTTPKPTSWPWSKFTTEKNEDFAVEGNDEWDDDTEALPYKVLEKRFNYEVRAYEKSKWVCTQKVKSNEDDPYLDWRLKYSDGWEAMRNTMKQKEKKDMMFKRLYKYIIGVNSEAAEIDMTRPVVTKRTPLARNRERREMCFWTGTEWADKELPEPLKKDVYTMEIPAIEVYVRKFSGFALSHKDWEDELDYLIEDLSNQADVDNSGTYYTAGYDGPWQEASERRNEIWLLKLTDTESSKLTSDGSNSWQQQNFQSADDKSELIGHEVLETTDEYELRRYPAAKWACTKEYEVDPLKDPMKDWEEKYGNSPMQAMSGTAWDEGPSNKMFMRLFRYILGVNLGSEEIKMTRPVTTSVEPIKRTRTFDQEMCFWLGTPYESKEAPKPIDRKVTIKERPAMVVYVRQFKGFAFSHQEWEEEYENLVSTLSDEETYDTEVWYHIGYNSPFTPAEQRRNEIWIPQV